MSDAAQEDLTGMPTPGLLTVSEKFPTNVKNDEGTVVAQCWADGRFTGEQYAALIVKAVNGHQALIDALKAAEQFITNGVEFGFIRMPDADDPANSTLPMIRSALAEVTP